MCVFCVTVRLLGLCSVYVSGLCLYYMCLCRVSLSVCVGGAGPSLLGALSRISFKPFGAPPPTTAESTVMIIQLVQKWM